MSSISLILKQFSRSVLLVTALSIWGITAHAQGDAAKGEALFKAKCTTCHKIDQRLIGPALGPQLNSETDDKWLIKWIQNNQALIAAHDPKATKIYNEFNQSGMTAFTDLSDADATNIITYVRGTWKDMQSKPAAPATAQTAEEGPSRVMVYGLIGVIILAFIVVLVLNKTIKTLDNLLKNRPEIALEPDATAEKVHVDRYATIKKLAKNKKFVFFVLICVSIA